MQGNKLYVGNLSYEVTGEELKGLFAAHGTVSSINIIQGKGFGFIEMGSPAEAEAAKSALDGQEFKGRQMRIDEARPPKEGGGGPRKDFGKRY
jgi:RNA recognition motif-containing protein